MKDKMEQLLSLLFPPRLSSLEIEIPDEPGEREQGWAGNVREMDAIERHHRRCR